jgi:hypothetical protein
MEGCRSSASHLYTPQTFPQPHSPHPPLAIPDVDVVAETVWKGILEGKSVGDCSAPIPSTYVEEALPALRRR